MRIASSVLFAAGFAFSIVAGSDRTGIRTSSDVSQKRLDMPLKESVDLVICGNMAVVNRKNIEDVRLELKRLVNDYEFVQQELTARANKALDSLLRRELTLAGTDQGGHESSSLGADVKDLLLGLRQLHIQTSSALGLTVPAVNFHWTEKRQNGERRDRGLIPVKRLTETFNKYLAKCRRAIKSWSHLAPDNETVMYASERVLDDVMRSFGTLATSYTVSAFLKHLPIAAADLIAVLEKMVQSQSTSSANGLEKRYSETAFNYLNGVFLRSKYVYKLKEAALAYATKEVTREQLFLEPVNAFATELLSVMSDEALRTQMGDAGVNRLNARIAVLQRMSNGVPPGDSIDLGYVSKLVSLPVESLEYAFDNIAMHNPNLLQNGVLIRHLAAGVAKMRSSNTDTKKRTIATPSPSRTVLLHKYLGSIKKASADHATSATGNSKVAEAVEFWRLETAAKRSIVNCPWTQRSAWYLYLGSVDVVPVFDSGVTIEHIGWACAQLGQSSRGIYELLYRPQLIQYVAYVNEHGTLPDPAAQ